MKRNDVSHAVLGPRGDVWWAVNNAVSPALTSIIQLRCFEIVDEDSALQAGDPGLDGHLSLALGKGGINVWQSHSTLMTA